MAYEIVVVGGGIGGLTTAALLAARGLSVCLFEKESEGGGCATTFNKFGYRFELGAGLYACWQPGEIHERVFAELPSPRPEVQRVVPAYVVRLPDGAELSVGGNDFEEQLRQVFPECARAACDFYRALPPIAEALHRAARRVPFLAGASRLQRLKLIASEPRMSARILAGANRTASQYLQQTSTRFRRFIDAQLQIFAQTNADDCAYLYAAVALSQPGRGMYGMRGGASALVEALVASIKRSGGTVRFDAPVLRLAYDVDGRVKGVDLLNGERVEASRAVVSNLTVWDTYGKLAGFKHTPAEVRASLKNLKGWGAYQIYLGMEERAAARLPATQVVVLTGAQDGRFYDPVRAQFMFSVAPEWDVRAPAGKRAVTVSTFTDVEEWFTFHEDDSEHEERDAGALKACWESIHAHMPELGDAVEVIETATPRTFYERTRRKLGMVGGVGQSLDLFGANFPSHRTALPNLYMVGDTVFPGNGVAAVTQSALVVADEIAPPTTKPAGRLR